MTATDKPASRLEIWKRRRAMRHVLKQAKYVLNCRIDVLDPKQIERFRKAEDQCRQHLLAAEPGTSWESCTQALAEETTKIAAPRRYPELSENLEIAAVALAIALGFRTYFYQPFKIPTGSMEKTLFGIYTEPIQPGTMTDRAPFIRFVSWIVDGTYVSEIRAQSDGTMSDLRSAGETAPNTLYTYIGGVRHALPTDAVSRNELAVRPGEGVRRGDVLWRGKIVAGDHVFVDRVRWNFCPPKRGQIVVFRTDHIELLDQGIHFIKRLIGLPGETVTIRAPSVYVDGKIDGGCAALARVANEPGYRTRRSMDPATALPPMANDTETYTVSKSGFFCMGDNTGHSYDSRYWGCVPEENMVGPAVFVYWPLSKRWGPLH